MNDLEKTWKKFYQSGLYFDAWSPRINPDRAEKEVEGVLDLLQPSAGSHILDWCGGYGRHSLPLAKMGFKITLLDFAPNHIAMAQKIIREQKVEVNTVCQDFRETPASIQADYAINLFTSGISYLSEQDDLKALLALHAALKPGALFMLDTMNLLWIIRNYKSDGGWISDDGSQRLLQVREFDPTTNRIKEKLVFWERNGRDREHYIEHRMYSARGLSRILRLAGFEPIKFYGGFDGRPLTMDTQRLIIISERK